jgi:selenocysteine lyase/cysteine desulfurase
MWNVKSKVAPVIIGATGTLSKSLLKYLSNIQESTKIGNTKKNSHTGHCTHTTENDHAELQTTFRGRNNITFRTGCKYKGAATLCTLDR